MKIFKYRIEIGDHVSVDMPQGAVILSAKSVPNVGLSREIDIWAIVNPDNLTVTRQFEIRGTGHTLGDVGEFITTVQDPPFVWHLFNSVVWEKS